jgi:hypothetical protein
MYMCGSDPHFAIRLAEGELLCYTFQGRHNTIFNLLGNDHLQMNALFVPDATDYDNTWLGSIRVTALRDGKKTTTRRFTAANQLVRIGERLQFNAKTIKKLTFNNGELSVLKVPSNHSQLYPRMLVDIKDSKLSLTVGFIKNTHLDLYWHSTRTPSKTPSIGWNAWARAAREDNKCHSLLQYRSEWVKHTRSDIEEESDICWQPCPRLQPEPIPTEESTFV